MTKGRFKTFDFWDGFVFGLAVFSASLFIFAWLFWSKSPEERSVLATLATIPAAFFAALVAFMVTRYQLNYGTDQDLRSAKAVLPLALTKLIEISESAIRIIAGQHQNPYITLDETRKELILPEDVIDILRDNIRSSDLITQEWLSALVSWYQVYFARINGWWDSPFPRVDPLATLHLDLSREQALLDWATLHALTANLFEYARNGTQCAPKFLDTNLIRSAFFHSIYEVELDDRFNKFLNIRLDRIQDGRIDHFRFHA